VISHRFRYGKQKQGLEELLDLPTVIVGIDKVGLTAEGSKENDGLFFTGIVLGLKDGLEVGAPEFRGALLGFALGALPCVGEKVLLAVDRVILVGDKVKVVLGLPLIVGKEVICSLLGLNKLIGFFVAATDTGKRADGLGAPCIGRTFIGAFVKEVVLGLVFTG
jgi:hypothetical protein